MNFIVLMTDDAVEEIKKLLDSANYYVNLSGMATYSFNNDISSLVFKELSA